MSSALSCPECHARFSVDQRYCVECGQRLRPVPRSVAATLATMSTPRRVGADRLNTTSVPAGGASSTTTSGGGGPTLFGARLELPSPRAMVVAVLMVIAFGVIITSGNYSLASSPLLLTVNRPAHTAAPPTPLALTGPTGSSSSSGSGSGAPASSSGSASSSSSSSSSGSTTAATTTSAKTTTAPGAAAGLPPIEHVWVIELGDQGYAQTFDNTSSDTYLNKTLASQGEVVPYVYASATSDLANEIGLVSGQGPTVQTEDNCPHYAAIKPGTTSGGQVKGSGCVYPKSTTSLPSELTAAGFTWKAYAQGLGTTAATSCTHPALNARDKYFTAKTANSYVTWRNPVVYLAGLASLKSCDSDDTGIGALAGDLKTVTSTPNVSFILPNTCDDGSDAPCHKGAAAGTKQSDTFLKSVVPKIMASPAYKKDGMIMITFAQAPQSGQYADHSSCCHAPTQFPNLPSANYVPASAGTTTTGTTTTGTVTAAITGTGTTTTSTEAGATDASATNTGATDATAANTGATATSAADTGTTDTSTTDTGTTGTTTTTVCPTTTGTTTTGTDTTTSSTDTTTTATGTDTTTTSCLCPTTTGTTTTGTDTTTSNTDTTATTGTGPTGTGPTGTDTTADCTGTGTATTPVNLGPGIATGGGGQVGMLVLSQYVTKNLQDGTDAFSTFSITASLEQLFGLKYTGYAATPGLPLFSGFYYSNYNDG